MRFFSRIGPVFAGATLLALGSSTPVGAAGNCNTVASSEAVAIVVCMPTATVEEWRAAGAAACKGKRAACNAWIWDDPTKAPKLAPEKDADMPKAQTGAARAVLVTPGGELIVLRKTK